jgi:hypothetical protein
MTIKNKAEDQLRAIFGKDFEPLRDAAFAENDARLEADLASGIGFDPSPITGHVESLFSSLGLTHAQQALVLTDILARSSKACHIARVINVKTLQGNLAAVLVQTAKEAGADYRDLVESAVGEIEDQADMAAVMMRA